MRDNEPMKFRFVLQDITSGNKLFVDSVTDLGLPGMERRIKIRKNNVTTGHHVIVLDRRVIKET